MNQNIELNDQYCKCRNLYLLQQKGKVSSYYFLNTKDVIFIIIAFYSLSLSDFSYYYYCQLFLLQSLYSWLYFYIIVFYMYWWWKLLIYLHSCKCECQSQTLTMCVFIQCFWKKMLVHTNRNHICCCPEWKTVYNDAFGFPAGHTWRTLKNATYMFRQ